jgi:hypothetical protein
MLKNDAVQTKSVRRGREATSIILKIIFGLVECNVRREESTTCSSASKFIQVQVSVLYMYSSCN